MPAFLTVVLPLSSVLKIGAASVRPQHCTAQQSRKPGILMNKVIVTNLFLSGGLFTIDFCRFYVVIQKVNGI